MWDKLARRKVLFCDLNSRRGAGYISAVHVAAFGSKQRFVAMQRYFRCWGRSGHCAGIVDLWRLTRHRHAHDCIRLSLNF